MEINVLEEKKNRLVFETNEDHTFLNLLKTKLWEDEGIDTATYAIEHPLVSKPKFIIETKDKDPRKALASAAKALAKEAEEFESEFKSAK